MVRQLEQHRPPVVAEVVMCVPINTILGSEVKKEQSLGTFGDGEECDCSKVHRLP